MHFAKTFALFLTLGSAVLASAFSRRDGPTIVSDLQVLNDRVGQISTALTLFSGSPSQSNNVINLLAESTNSVQKLLSDTNASPRLSPPESRAVATTITSQEEPYLSFITKFISKEPLFAALGDQGTVLTFLIQYRDALNQFSTLISSKLTPSDAIQVGGVVQQIVTKLQTAIDTYS